MDINQNNSQINTFSGGMNSDMSLDLVTNTQYLFGLNIRITNNTLIKEAQTSNNKEGIVTPVQAGEQIVIGDMEKQSFKRVLAVDSIDDLGIIIVQNTNDTWSVIRVDYDEANESVLNCQLLFTSEKKVKSGVNRFSTVLNEELKGIVKLYIATGQDEILQLFVKYDKDNNWISTTEFTRLTVIDFNFLYKREDFFKSNYIFPTNKLTIAAKISGRLKASQVQYTYRYYKQYGISSRLSPLTNKIQVINDSKHSENGCAEDTETNIGFLLNVPCNNGFKQIFDRLQIFRLDYIHPNQGAEVNLIYDGELIFDNTNISINDTGSSVLLTLTIDEFAAISGQDIIPTTIESNLGYMFASNIEDKTSIYLDIKDYNPRAYQFNSKKQCVLYKDDDTIYKTKRTFNTNFLSTGADIIDYTHNEYSDVNYSEDINSDTCFLDKDGYLGGSGPNISWRFVSSIIDVHQDVNRTKRPDVSFNPDKLKLGKFYEYEYNSSTNKVTSKLIPSYTEVQYISDKCVYNDGAFDYNNIIGSSILRSLQRDEVYRYGIVFYDERGARTDVLWIADIRTPNINTLPNFIYTEDNYGNLYTYSDLKSVPLGIKFTVKMPVLKDSEHTFVGYEIVRCEKTYTNTHNVIQGALSRPVRQLIPEKDNKTAYSPYYPTGLICTNNFIISEGVNSSTRNWWADADNFSNLSLFLLFNPQILYQREDILLLLLNIDINIDLLSHASNINSSDNSYDLVWGNGIDTSKHNSGQNFLSENNDPVGICMDRMLLMLDGSYGMSYKLNKTTIYNSYNIENIKYHNTTNIIDVLDVVNPTWELGFTNIKLNSDAKVATAVSAYKSFITSIQNETYINWACCGMYDISTGVEDKHGLYNDLNKWLMYINTGDGAGSSLDLNEHQRKLYSHGYIGPGPVCFILKTKEDLELQGDESSILNTNLCNITHNAIQFAGLTEQEKQYDLYFGFGNFLKFNTNEQSSYVFDGDIYNIPCEFVSLFKTYDFNCLTDALPSTLIVYYIPLESKINTFFDYGMNYKNTTNPNLLLEPGRIEGVSSQTRPLHLINLIYSDNANTNNMFNPLTISKGIDIFQQRIIYSQLKTNGEGIDNWLIFKAIDFIDVDSRYGELTNILAVNDIIYFWQDQAFGKLSVNERSLVTDNNSNTVQLGQAGVLQRSDYLDTKHGLRKYDYAALHVGGVIFWIDILNKCITAFDNQVVNYSEAKNVQNIINTYCIDKYNIKDDQLFHHLPTINYDLLNEELICDCLYGQIFDTYYDKESEEKKERTLLIFNTKLNVSTAIYNRSYHDILSINNRLYGIKLNSFKLTKYNHLDKNEDLLTPTVLHFVVNQTPGITKVFDNQQINTLKKTYNNEEINKFFSTKYICFETDLNKSFVGRTTNDLIQYDNDYYQITNRESNIRYPIPRETKDLNDRISDYGHRLRGKWMLVFIRDYEPKIDYSISHIITKFRQSFN